MNIIGIDPGINGGIALWNHDRMFVFPMGKTAHDTFEILKDFRDSDKAYLEKVHSMPQQGVASTFTFGMHYGFIRGILVALSIPFEEVSPQRWQGGLGIIKRDIKAGESKAEHKTKLLAKAQELFPSLKFTLRTADAALIAEYGRRNEMILSQKKGQYDVTGSPIQNNQN